MRWRGAIAAGLILLTTAGAADARAAGRIGPGVLMDTEGGGGCTSNFVFRDATDVYLGYAAHCAQDDGSTEPRGDCASPALPLGTRVEIEGAGAPGRLAYSSWRTMRAVGEVDPAVCSANDFAIVRIDPQDHALVDPSVPFWGGPTGLRRARVERDETMVSYGRSNLRFDVEELKPREGYVAHSDGWFHTTWFLTMAVWGDSGSAVLDGAGGAVGVMVTIAPLTPGANGVTDLAHALDYMRAHGGPDARLVSGTAPFAGARTPERRASPASEPEPPAATEPPAREQPQEAPPPAQAPPPASPQSAPPAPPAAKPKPKPAAKKPKRRKARRCRTRGANRRSARGRKAPRCARGKQRRARNR